MNDKWIVFDAMGVVFEISDDTNDLLVPYIKNIDKNISNKQINMLYIKTSLGEITPKDFWFQLGLGKYYPQIEKEYLDTCLTLDKDFIGLATQLKAKYKIAMLSNDVGKWSQYLRKIHGLDKYFDEVVISSDVGYRKPSNEIFKILLNKLNCQPENCIFIDDSIENLKSSMNFYIKTIWFNRNLKHEYAFSGMHVDSFKQLEKMLK